jgi:hypothetical protein
MPKLLAGVEKKNPPSRRRIDSGQIIAFEQIAVVTGPGEVVLRRESSVLFGDDMVWLKRRAVQTLGHPAIFASVVRSLSDECSQALGDSRHYL